MKRFARDGQPLETRFMVRHDDGDWAGYSYAWSEDGTSAAYAAGGGGVATAEGHWGVPSGAQCLQCHTNVVGRTLGPELGQLAGDYLYPNGRTRDQLATLEHIGMFDFAVPSDVEPLYSADDDRVGIEVRARSVLHANCAGCHQPEGTGGGELDLRFGTNLEDMGVCNVVPTGDDFGIGGAALLVPGDASSSMLAVRMARRGLGQMPPIATDQVDEVGLGVVQSWINDIGACP
jgi:mono/diheme cytochrome c family protein